MKAGDAMPEDLRLRPEEGAEADEERKNGLRGKFHPVLLEMDRRRVKLLELDYRNNKLYLRGEAPDRDALNYVWDEIRAIDQDLVDITADITVGEGRREGEPKAADREIRRTVTPEPNKVRQGGDRGTPTGTS